MEESDVSPNRQETAGTENWSQQSEANESERLSTLAIMEGDVDNRSMNNIPPADASESIQSTNLGGLLETEETSSGLAPMREEPTLKEKLVERERQRRVETERARLKRQFALSSDGGGVVDEESTSGAQDGLASRENGSVAGTVGEGSTVAQMDPYEGEGEKGLTYPMERFLEEQVNVIEEEPLREKTRDTNQGVVMERFLKQSVVVDPQDQDPSGVEASNVDGSVSFDREQQSTLENSVEGPSTSAGEPTPADIHDDAGASIAANVSIADDHITSENPRADLGEVSSESEPGREEVPPSDPTELEVMPHIERPLVDPSMGSDQPRVLRLTLAEIQEMAEIDDASRSNAPPSERDDISDSSFVGELISDFGGQNVDAAGTLSQGTPTTAMESGSIFSGNQSAQPISETNDDDHSMDALGTGSISSHSLAGSVAGGSVSVHPPSDIGADDVPSSPIPDEIHSSANISLGPDGHSANPVVPSTTDFAPASQMPHEEESLDLQASMEGNAGVVNRKIRPGMLTLKQLRNLDDQARQKSPSTPIRRAASLPDNMNFDLEDFDYDKNAETSPASALTHSIQDLPANDMWSPGSKMSVSPFRPRVAVRTNDQEMTGLRNYGAAHGGELEKEKSPRVDEQESERKPLLPSTPREIISPSASDRVAGRGLDHLYCDIRSKRPAKEHDYENEAIFYRESSILKRALPERFFALMVTFVVEIPVLLMVSGGSDRLCEMTGRSKYQLLMGFLPLSSAISGNVGLQASTLTTRAISHGHVKIDDFGVWLKKEVGAAIHLGLAMGFCLGATALVLGGFSFPFGFTVMVAQFVSIVTAGLTGTLAPMLFSFVFERDPGKWGGPLETAVQDIVGSFAMVVLSYKILEILGPMEVEPGDMCQNSGFT